MYHLYTDMSLIEGVGDEVTVVFTIFLLCLVLCIAWISTNIQELPFFSVIVIEFTRRQNRNQENSNSVESTESSTSSSTSSDDSAEEPEIENVTASSSDTPALVSAPSNKTDEAEVPVKSAKTTNENENSSGNAPQTSGEIIGNDIQHAREVIGNNSQPSGETNEDDDLPATETELRRRRVAFFSGKNGSVESVNENPDNLQSKTSQENHVKTASEPRDNGKQVSGTQPSNETNIIPSSESVPGTSDKVRIRLKYLNETQRNVEASLDDTIEQFRRAHFQEELAANKLVRFIFNGQDLRNDRNTLQAYNIVDNSVIHCLITQASRQTPPARDADGEGFDIGMLMLPCFGLILCFMWYLRFEYKQFFSGTSTVCLIGITLLFIAAILAAWENRRTGPTPVHAE